VKKILYSNFKTISGLRLKLHFDPLHHNNKLQSKQEHAARLNNCHGHEKNSVFKPFLKDDGNWKDEVMDPLVPKNGRPKAKTVAINCRGSIYKVNKNVLEQLSSCEKYSVF
jgi:hypothetical protein